MTTLKNGWVDSWYLTSLLGTVFFLPTMFGSISIVLSLVLALLVTIRFWIRKTPDIDFIWQPTLTMLLASFALLGLIFVINADEPKDVGKLVNFLGLAFPILLYQYLVGLKRPPSLKQIAAFCFLGTIMGLLFAHAQHFGLGMYRTVALAAGSNAVARVALILGFLTLVGMSFNWREKSNLAMLGLFASFGIVILSGSRGSLLAIPFMGLVAMAFALPHLWHRSKLLVLLFLLGAAMLVGSFVHFDPGQLASRTIHTLSELTAGRMPGSSSGLRYEMLVGAWSAFQASPWVGYGWAGLWDAAIQFHPTPEILAPVEHYFSFHNDIADFAVAGGILGLLAYALIIVAPIINLLIDPRLRRNAPVAYALVLLPVSYLVMALTDFMIGYDLFTTLYGFSLAFILATAHNSAREAE